VSRRRKVLFVTASYPTPDQPLLGIFVKEHARAAASHADVAVLHLDRRADAGPPFDVRAGEDDEFPTVRVRYPSSPAPLSYLMNVAGAAAGYRRLGFDADVLHAHFFLAGVPAVLLGRLLRRPVVLTEQWSVFLPEDSATLSPLMQRVAKFAFEHVAVVLPVSDALRDGIRALGVRADFRVVPNVVDERRFCPADAVSRNGRPRRLIGVGGLYEAKGWEFLLEALAIVAREHSDVRLDIVGDGELRSRYEELTRRLGLDELVTFHGWVSKDEVAARVRESDLFVLTSRYDSNPCAVIEALASGVPAVATAVGGIPDIVRDGMGLLAAPGDVEDIAAKIRCALDRLDDWDRTRIAQAARERYGSDRVGRELAAIYDEVIGRRR
jgi:glycosyltransferase involved in cell wall biosynthesis